MKQIRIGTRGSALALKQTEEVKQRLLAYAPDIAVQTVVIRTLGDRNLSDPLSELGDKGLFTKELEQALFDGSIDLAVHSMKDMPGELPGGLDVAAVLPREDARDVFVGNGVASIRELPEEARVGTSSLRRMAQLRAIRPDVAAVSIRGNVETRIRKMREEGLDGILLACAGIKRLGLTEHITEILPEEQMLPAPCQGIIAVEMTQDAPAFSRVREALNDPDTFPVAQAERAFLQRMEGGCKVPMAALAQREGDTLIMRGRVLDLDGSQIIEAVREGACEDAATLGLTLADDLLEHGAGDILQKIRKGSNDA